MEFLTKDHKQQAEKFLQQVKRELTRPPSKQLLQKLGVGTGTAFAELLKQGLECMKSDVTVASVIWEYTLAQIQAVNQTDDGRMQDGKFVALHQCFLALVCTGPWDKALETAKLFLSEVNGLMRCHDQLPGLNKETLVRHSFVAHIDTGTGYRLLKDLDRARELFNKSLEIAVELKDDDKKSLAKVHLVLCLLDEGQLKEAIDTYLTPMLQCRNSMSPQTHALYLQQFGNACRSAAKWGEARKYLQEALKIAKGLKDLHLVSNCFGDLGNVFRSEGRYKLAENYHKKHIKFALKRGDLHGVAVSHGNLGFLKFYNPEEYDQSVVYQTVEFELAKEIGDFGRTGIAMNKIGKLYTTLQHNDQAVGMFRFAIECHQRAHNIAGEGMAWGNLGTVYRALGRYDDAIHCHENYRDNAKKRLDVGGVAIMQTQIALDYLLKNDLKSAEAEVLEALGTLEAIRRQLGEDDQAKISNFEKNQSEAYNILQVVLVRQGKFKKALVLSETARARALADLVKKKFEVNQSVEEGKSSGTFTVDNEFIDGAYKKILSVCCTLNTIVVLYSLIKEPTGEESERWVYVWVVHPSGTINFTKTLLQGDMQTKVKVDEKLVIDLARSLNHGSSMEKFLARLKSEEEQARLRDAPRVPFAEYSSHDGNEQQLLDDFEESLFQRPDTGKDMWNKGSKDISFTGHHPFTLSGVDAKLSNSNITAFEVLEEGNEQQVIEEETNTCVSSVKSKESVEKSKAPRISTGESNTLDAGGLSETIPVNDPSNKVFKKSSNHSMAVESGLSLGSENRFIETRPNESMTGKHTATSQSTSNVDFIETRPNESMTGKHTATSQSISNVDFIETRPNESVTGKHTATSQSTSNVDFIETRPNESMTGKHTATSQSTSNVDFPETSLEDQNLPSVKSVKTSEVEETIDKIPLSTPTEKPTNIMNKSLSSCAEVSVIKFSSPMSKPVASDSSLHQNGHGLGKDSKEAKLKLEPCVVLMVESEKLTGKPEEQIFEQKIQNKEPQIKDGQKDESVKGTKSQAASELFDKAHSIDVPSPEPFHTQAETTSKIASSSDGSPKGTHSNVQQTDTDQNVQPSQASHEQDDWKNVLSQLNRVLIEPINEFIPRSTADVSRVVFIPQDFLLKVPFAALRDENNEIYLNNKFVVSTCPSVQLLELTTARLMNLRQASPPQQLSLLAVGNPKMLYEELPALPAASREVRKVNEIMTCPKSEVLVWSRATKNRVMTLMPEYKILHFASHAIVDEESSHGDYSMRGFIVFASSGDKCNGLLSAEEVRGMKLSAELVVLSCCETGRGKVTGDGVLGLSRAFLAAGAACVVVTLWKIDDRSTARLIEYFYRDYKISRDASHALHTAMKNFEKQDKSLSPRHWAAFSIVGSTGKWEGR